MLQNNRLHQVLDKSKILVLADNEIFFLPHLLAKLAQRDLIHAIVIRKNCNYSLTKKLNTIIKLYNAFGPLTILNIIISFFLAKLTDIIFPSKFFSLKKVANRFKIKTYYVEKLHDEIFLSILKKEKPTFVFSECTVKINKSLLKKSPFINRHCGLLPEYAGVNPVFWAMLNNKKFLGVTLHLMDEGYDSGDILGQKKIENINLSFFAAYHAMYDLTADLFFEILNNEISPKIQNPEKRSYYSWQGRKERKAFKLAGYKFGFPYRFHPNVLQIK